MCSISGWDYLCRRFMRESGIGPIIASAYVATVGDPVHYRNGRQLAASLGLVPRQHSTGGKSVLLGISKRGDRYLRTQLIHGARAVLRHVAGKTDPLSVCLQQLARRRGVHIAAVALANKSARAPVGDLARRRRAAGGVAGRSSREDGRAPVRSMFRSVLGPDTVRNTQRTANNSTFQKNSSPTRRDARGFAQRNRRTGMRQRFQDHPPAVLTDPPLLRR